MKSFTVLALALLTSAGCTPTTQMVAQRMGQDPTIPCNAAIAGDQRAVPLAGKLYVLNGNTTASMEMLADRTTPTATEKAAISWVAAEYQRCHELGRAHRAASGQPRITEVLDKAVNFKLVNLAKLYNSEITYGEYMRVATASAADSRRDINDALAAHQQRIDRANAIAADSASRSLATSALILNASRPQPVAPAFRPTINCTSRALGTTIVQTDCN